MKEPQASGPEKQTLGRFFHAWLRWRVGHPTPGWTGKGIFSEWTEFTGKKYDATTRRPVLPPWVQSYLLKYGVPIRKTGGW